MFKVWYPLTGRELDFDQASVRFTPAARTFSALLRADPGPAGACLPEQLTGRYAVGAGLVVSAITLPRS